MTRRLALPDLVRELTQTHTQRTPREHDGNGTRYRTDHLVTQPPLITQLWSSVDPASQGGEVGSTTATSKPAANLDAIDAAAEIDIAAARWVSDLTDEDAPTDTIDTILRLHGLTASVKRCDRGKAGRSDSGRITCCPWHAIEADVRRWWVRARVLTGHDTAPWKPEATCPLCGERRTLVVRMALAVATCKACRETWDPDTIGLLADHIRAESEEGQFRQHLELEPCAPATELAIALQPRMFLCPDCGKRSCWKAGVAQARIAKRRQQQAEVG